MKRTSKILSLVLALVMVFSFAACAQQTPEEPSTEAPKTEAPKEEAPSEEKKDGPEIKAPKNMEFEAFSFKVNGKEINNEALKDCQPYKITVETTNSKGNTAEATYGGYAIKDVLAAAGVENATKITAIANDGYEVEYEITDENAAYTLIAIEKDRELGEDGTVWLAPCFETVAQNYAKLVVEIKAE